MHLEIKVYMEISDKNKILMTTFIKENFNTINWNDKEIISEIEEWYWKPADVHLLAYRKDILVGVAHISKRFTSVDNQEILVACLGGLVVSKNHRNQGIARKLIEERLIIAKEWNADIAFLNTEILQLGKIFEKFGFVPLRCKYSFTSKSGKLIEDNSGMIAPIGSQEVFEKIQNSDKPLYIGDGNL